MNELNLSISTGKESNKVVLTAGFATHEEAVKFHAAIAELCKQANNMPNQWGGNTARMLGLYK